MILYVGIINAQSIERSVLATAGNFSNDNIQMSWTIGESITETYTTGTVKLTQGFQQEESLLTQVPIELISSDVKRQNMSIVDLSWTTTAKLNVDGFLLERRLDIDSEFEVVEFVSSKDGKQGIKAYTYEDDNYHFGETYYRIKMMNHDGSFEYTDVKVVPGIPLEHAIEAFPVPFNNELNISITVDKRKRIDEVFVEIIDFNGSLVYKAQHVLNGPGVQLNDLGFLPTGAYHVRVSSSKTILGNIKLIKVRD